MITAGRSAGHIVLVGMTGTGKTTVGRAMADRLGRRLLDTDALVEERTGRSVREIFETDGEATFRVLEAAVLADALATPEAVVIAAAGGVVLSEANRLALRTANVRIVWLSADPALLAQRIRGGGHRPLLDRDPEGTLRTMFDERAALYREVADAVVSVDGRSVPEIIDAVLR